MSIILSDWGKGALSMLVFDIEEFMETLLEAICLHSRPKDQTLN